MSNPENIILPALVEFYKAHNEYYMPQRDGTLQRGHDDYFNNFVTLVAKENNVDPKDYFYETENYKIAIERIYGGASKQPIACGFSYYLLFGKLHLRLELLGRYTLENFEERIVSVFSDMIKCAPISDIEQFVKYVRERLNSNIFFKMNYIDDSQKFRDLCKTLKEINNQKQEIS